MGKLLAMGLHARIEQEKRWDALMDKFEPLVPPAHDQMKFLNVVESIRL